MSVHSEKQEEVEVDKQKTEASRGQQCASCVSHIHTLWMKAGDKRVLEAAWVPKDLLGSGARVKLQDGGI